MIAATLFVLQKKLFEEAIIAGDRFELPVAEPVTDKRLPINLGKVRQFGIPNKARERRGNEDARSSEPLLTIDQIISREMTTSDVSGPAEKDGAIEISLFLVGRMIPEIFKKAL
jgi:hypothetical protein